MKKSLVVILVLLTVLTSCASFLPWRFENFVDRVEKNAPFFEDQDWEKTNKEFQSLIEQYENAYDNLSIDDQNRIENAVSRYYTITVKYARSRIIDKVQDVVRDLSIRSKCLKKAFDSWLEDVDKNIN